MTRVENDTGIYKKEGSNLEKDVRIAGNLYLELQR